MDPTTGESYRAATRREGAWPKSLAIAAPSCATAGVKGRVMPLNAGRCLGGRFCKQLEDLGPRSAKGCVQHSLKSRLLLSTSTSCFFFLWLLFLCGELGERCQLLCCFQLCSLDLWSSGTPRHAHYEMSSLGRIYILLLRSCLRGGECSLLYKSDSSLQTSSDLFLSDAPSRGCFLK